MSIICGLPLLECVYCLACARWAWKRCLHTAGLTVRHGALQLLKEFEPVPRICRLILAVYEEDLRHPFGPHLAATALILIGRPKYGKESDYAVLLDNKLGQREFDGGYVHNGLLNAAWGGSVLAMVVVQNRDRLGNIDRKRIRGYAIAPARCMSLNFGCEICRCHQFCCAPGKFMFFLLDGDFTKCVEL
ncbi:hypothetical protein HHK36_032047 [Tetracentron sinense]|uniref:Mono-/di-acylglycerol lipase N-terminal domain-containing protein n=1 Tax=Tetracentron sinense TaxID=13715 RepID=A0A834YBE6_TETSI|nr:hypothetical protein HHK36_032047 [Tetracentron sinense]